MPEPMTNSPNHVAGRAGAATAPSKSRRGSPEEPEADALPGRGAAGDRCGGLQRNRQEDARAKGERRIRPPQPHCSRTTRRTMCRISRASAAARSRRCRSRARTRRIPPLRIRRPRSRPRLPHTARTGSRSRASPASPARSSRRHMRSSNFLPRNRRRSSSPPGTAS